MRRRDHNDGFVLVTAALLIMAILIVAFLSLYYVYAVRLSLANLRANMLAAQQMHSATPNRIPTIIQGAWTLRLQGYGGVLPVETLQTLPNGSTVQLSFDGSKVPSEVTVRTEVIAAGMLGLLQKLLAGTGFVAAHSIAEMNATSFDSVVSVHADMSSSMVPPWPANNATPAIHDLLLAYGFQVDSDQSKLCYPIYVGDAPSFHQDFLDAGGQGGGPGNSVLPRQLERFVCNLRRKQLPFFYSDEPMPLAWSFELMRPMNVTAASVAPNNVPADGFPPFRYLEGSPHEHYNPGKNYNVHRPPGDDMLVCGFPMPRQLPTCDPGDLTTNCFPLQPTVSQFNLNKPGMRLFEDYEFEKPGCDHSNPTNGCIASGVRYTDRFCFRPWKAEPNVWMTQEEYDYCTLGNPPSAPELLGSGGCDTQLGDLHHAASDYLTTYKRTVQGFLIGIAGSVFKLRFSEFSGPTPWGNVQQSDDLTGGPVLGNRLLYPNYTAAGNPLYNHIYEDDIAKIINQHWTRTAGGGIPVGNFGYHIIGAFRLTHMLAYLNQTLYPHMTSTANGHSAIQPWNHAFAGTTTFHWPPDDPLHPFIDASTYSYGIPSGRSPTWELKQPGMHVTDPVPAHYSLSGLGDVWDNGSNRFFPRSDIGKEWPSFQPYHTSWNGVFDWPPLREVYHTNGAGPAGTQVPGVNYTPEIIKTVAASAWNFLNPTTGGTDHRAVFLEMDNSCAAPPPGGPASPFVGVVITDGVPNLDCDPNSIRPGLTCNAIPFGGYTPPFAAGSHMESIYNSLYSLRNKGAMVVLLFIQYGVNLSPEAQAFLSLFQGSNAVNSQGKVDRVAFVLPLTSVSAFTAQLKEAFAAIKAIILGRTKLV